jgi:hypothetical protein
VVAKGISGKDVEPGDALLVPQRIRRDINWTEGAGTTALAWCGQLGAQNPGHEWWPISPEKRSWSG